MSIVKKAVKESKDVARLAVDAAKNELIEQLTPSIQAIINAQLRRGVLGEDVDRLRRSEDNTGETEFEEGIDMRKDKFESVAALFPAVNEVSEGADEDMNEADDAGYDDIDEAADEEMDETL